MKVGIDITPIIYRRGVSRYTTNLVRALQEEDSVLLAAFGYSFRQKKQLAQFVRDHKLKTYSLHQTPPSMMKWWWRLGQKKVRQYLPDLDLFHSWDWLQPPDQDLPLVSTVHDVTMIKFPQTAHRQILRAHQKSWQVLKDRQAQIIAVSRATKKDIVDLLGIPKYQISVVHEALPAEFKHTSNSLTEDEVFMIKQQLGLDKPYLLAVGTREPRKNLLRLIQAWQPLAKDYQLIIAGEQGWDQTEQISQPDLRLLGQVSDRELAVLYGEAEVFCYPSLYEGFGLPILESFFHGTPVVTASVSSMPEVAGNAAELVDPESVGDIGQAIKKILNEDIQAQRERLQRMIIRLQMFTWSKVATETIAVYQQALQLNS